MSDGEAESSSEESTQSLGSSTEHLFRDNFFETVHFPKVPTMGNVVPERVVEGVPRAVDYSWVSESLRQIQSHLRPESDVLPLLLPLIGDREQE